jgi:hypothetical protein
MRYLKTIFILHLSLLICANVLAQKNIENYVDSLNSAIDKAVVNKNMAFLNTHYGDDFVFTHGTGLVDSKKSWIDHIADLTEQNKFLSRNHDSTNVELHNDIALVNGKLSVTRLSNHDVKSYGLRYVRLYAFRNKIWQLISHRTTHEWH